MVVTPILPVVQEVPVPRIAPPLEAAYQFTTPALAVADKATVPVPHLSPGIVDTIVATPPIVATTGVRTKEPHAPSIDST